MLTFCAGSAKAGTALMTAAVASADTAMIFRVCLIGRLLFEKQLLI
jgi:hypothetical protein